MGDDIDFERKLFEHLIEAEALSSEDIDLVLRKRKSEKLSLRAAIVGLGLADEATFIRHWVALRGFPTIDLASSAVEPETLALLPAETCREHVVLPVSRAGDRLTIAAADPTNAVALDDIRFLAGMELEVRYAPPEQIRAVMSAHGMSAEPEGDPPSLPAPLLEDDGGPLTLESAISGDDDHPVVTLVARILMRSATQGAGTIHLEPTETGVRVRFRIDGVLHDVARLPLSVRASATARLKILANMDISERRRPQYGRFTLRTKKGELEFLVATQPTALDRAERIVLRRLQDAGVIPELAGIGHDPKLVEAWKQALGMRGLALICGPSGSGRTTTYYASLAWLGAAGMSVVSAEAVVERLVPGTTQTPLNPMIGLTTSAALGSALRSDPDVIAISSLEDAETATMAVRGALAGRRVIAGLHVGRAHEGPGRLMDMGLEPELVAHGVAAVLAQRLVRTLCPSCREAEGGKEAGRYRAKGCVRCHGTGYRGRLPLGELLVVDEEVREALLRGAPPRALGDLARKRGMRTMRDAAMAKVASGTTSLAEVLSVLGPEER